MTDEAKAVFKNNILGSLATVNKDGSPWSTPLHLITDGVYVYWFSDSRAQHSVNVEADQRVSVTLFSPDMSQGLEAVYVNGQAERVGGESIQAVRDLLVERVGSFPRHFESAAAYKLPVGELDAEKTVGKCWYFYSR